MFEPTKEGATSGKKGPSRKTESKPKTTGVSNARASKKQPVARLARDEKTSAPILAGVIQYTGWAPETEVTASEFRKKVSEWSDKTVGG